jgi:hypothetical protein
MIKCDKSSLQILHNERNEAVHGFPENLTELARLNGKKFFRLQTSDIH